MTYRASEKVLSGGFPGAVYHPSDPDEGKGEVGRGDGYETKERYGCGRVAPRPEVNWDKGEGRGKEGKIHERGENL